MKYHIHPDGGGVLEGDAGMAISTAGQYPLSQGWFASQDMHDQGFLIGEFDEATFEPLPIGKRLDGYEVVGGQLAQVTSDIPIQSLSPRQLLLGLMVANLITPEEAENAAFGALPSGVLAVVNTLTAEEQIAAKITWAKMVTVERNHPLVEALRVSAQLTQEEVDNFFRTCAAL